MRIKGGMLVAIEGIDGCGKSITMSRLMRLVCQHHIAVQYAKETTKTEFGKFIRNIILNPNIKLNKSEQTTIFAMARLYCLKQIIIPALQQNELVLCDRYLLSNLAYQADLQLNRNGMKYDKTRVKALNETILGMYYIPPTFYAYVNMPIKDNIARLSKRTRKQDNIDKSLCNVNNMKKLERQFQFAIHEVHEPVLQVSGLASPEQRGAKIFKVIWNYIQNNNLVTYSKKNTKLDKHFELCKKEL